MIHFKEIDYIPISGQQFEIYSKDKSKLSDLSLDLIDTILKKRVTVVFSQGPLNITPFISCLYAISNKDNIPNNVVIGLPKQIFQDKYKEYTSEYFSLLYRKILDSSVTNPFFFYKDILWCKGKIDEEKNELFDLIIEKYPVHGKSAYRDAYEKAVTEKLHTAHYNKSSKIVLIPIEYSIPSNISEVSKIQFKETNYNIRDFNPRMVILESINERHFQFEHLKNLIKKTGDLKLKLVLHFSWPYLRGLTNFLSDPDIKNNSDIEIFHFGKRFCLESKNKFQKPPIFALPLSLEGNLWNTVYYPENANKSNISIFVLPNQQDSQHISLKSLTGSYSTVDNRLQNIRDSVKFENIVDNFTKNILIFPTIIDSFLIPSEIKVRSYVDRIKAIRYVTIQDFLKFKTDGDSHSFQSFQSLCADIESCKDISRELRGLRTYSALNKKTLLQIYLIEEIQKAANKIKLFHGEENSNEEISIIIPKLHPFFETRKNNFESLQYFFESFSFLLNHIKLPNVIKKTNKIVIKAGTEEIAIFEDTAFKIPSCERVHGIIDREKKYPIEVSLTKEPDFLEISVALKIQIPYVRIEEFDKNCYRKEYCKGLDIYRLKITPDGQYFEMYLSGFSNESKLYSNSLSFLIKFVTSTSTSSKTHQVQLNIDLIDLSSICHSSQEKIVRSRLLMPGPVPFQTISNGELSISQGYDALLLPFKEIVFFAYPGKNLQRIAKQFGLYKEIFSEDPTRISNLDLLYSIEHMNKSKRYEFPQKPSIEDIVPQNMADGDTVFDAAVRTELLDESRATEDEKEEITTLKEIWTRIGRKKPVSGIEYSKPSPDISLIQREQIILKIKFDDGTEDSISFMSGTLIRRRSGEDFVLTQVDELVEDDEILYIESIERESIDNFLLRDFVQEKGISLEQIFEPFYCLRLFYETLNSVDYFGDYPADTMKKLYWLNETQNMALFKMLQLLLREPNLAELDMRLHDVNNIYSGQLSSDQLTQTFTGRRNQITYEKLFKLAQFVGLSLAKDTFKQYCTFAINEHQHYYFKNERDLLALGHLIGHQRIIDDYQIINSQGRDVGTILQIIGRSIARVTRGISDQFSEMDASIEGKVQRCVVISIILPEDV
jgi:transcriptional regulator with XRE-family HTH domain